MTRREVAYYTLLGISLYPLTAFKMSCNRNEQSNLADQLETAGGALVRLLQIMGQDELAGRLQNNVQTSVALIRSWQPGQSAADVLRSLNRILDTINGIGDLERFRPLITLVLGTIAGIIDGIHALGGQGETAHTDVKLTKPPQSAQEFKDMWDHIRAGGPGMEQAPIL